MLFSRSTTGLARMYRQPRFAVSEVHGPPSPQPAPGLRCGLSVIECSDPVATALPARPVRHGCTLSLGAEGDARRTGVRSPSWRWRASRARRLIRSCSRRSAVQAARFARNRSSDAARCSGVRFANHWPDTSACARCPWRVSRVCETVSAVVSSWLSRLLGFNTTHDRWPLPLPIRESGASARRDTTSAAAIVRTVPAWHLR